MYIECVVLANGETDPELYKDSQGDTWDSKTIKQVFTTEANQSNHDLYHNKEKVDGVTTISNYISTEDKTVAGRTVPSGSWLKELMITDTDVIEMIKSNQLNGVSPNFRLRANSTCAKELKNIEGSLFYNKDIKNKECMTPVFLSLVDEPANEYGLEVYSYDKYLAKSKTGGKRMANKFKEMLKGFGESIVNYANEMPELEKADTTPESAPAETTSTDTTETPGTESMATATIVPQENSFEDLTEEVQLAVMDKYFPKDENGNQPYVNVVLTFKDAAIIQNWDDDEYYKVDYTIEDDKAVLGELQPVELQYVVVGSESTPAEETPAESAPAESTTEQPAAESQKSRQPKIKLSKIRMKEEKLDSVESVKGKEERVNHLGFPIRSTKELAKSRNSFNF